MPSFRSDIVDIFYEVTGEGSPVLLIHGFASNARVNWWDTGWVKTLNDAGYQAITFDNRGHGMSTKLYDEAAYPASEMAEDARRLLDHLGIRQVLVMGYSMGARIAAFLTINHPERVRAAVFAGLAENMIKGLGGSEPIARALEAVSVADVTDPGARAFRLFAEQTKSDLKALAACMRSERQKITRGRTRANQGAGAGGGGRGRRYRRRGPAPGRCHAFGPRCGAGTTQSHECRRRPPA